MTRLPKHFPHRSIAANDVEYSKLRQESAGIEDVAVIRSGYGEAEGSRTRSTENLARQVDGLRTNSVHPAAMPLHAIPTD